MQCERGAHRYERIKSPKELAKIDQGRNPSKSELSGLRAKVELTESSESENGSSEMSACVGIAEYARSVGCDE